MHTHRPCAFSTWLCLAEVRLGEIHDILHDLRQGSPPPTEKEIGRLMNILCLVFQATGLAQKCVYEHTVDQKRDLQAVCQEARDAIVAVGWIQIAISATQP